MFTMLMLTGALALTPPMPQQDDPQRQGPPLFKVQELVLQHYTPQHVSSYELLELAQHMVGRKVFIVERGGYESPPVTNMSLLGDNLVLYDTADYAKQMLVSLKALDQPGSDESSASSGDLATIEYSPRFISLDGAFSALGSFQRTVFDRKDAGHPNISVARDRALLVVREDPERLAEIQGLLERIDVPKPQVLITCHLLRGADPEGAEGDSGLPADLLTNLSKLVPGTSFEKVGFGMLRSAVVPNSVVSLKLETNLAESFELSFSPVALDQETGALSVAECTLTRDKRSQQGAVSAGDSRIRIFSTDTLFRGDEYTVLGASGRDPIYVVVRVAPVGI